MFLINTCMAIFKGFSTIDKVRAPYTLTDIDLVKRDLLNHFYTKKGERLMKPNFGSIIWDLLMEPEDTVTEEEIKDDIKRIIDTDPRVTLRDITLYIMDHTIRADVALRFNPGSEEDVLYLEFINETEGFE